MWYHKTRIQDIINSCFHAILCCHKIKSVMWSHKIDFFNHNYRLCMRCRNIWYYKFDCLISKMFCDIKKHFWYHRIHVAVILWYQNRRILCDITKRVSIFWYHKVDLYAPTLKYLVGHIAFGLFVRTYVTLFYASCNFWTMKARVLKFHI